MDGMQISHPIIDACFVFAAVCSAHVGFSLAVHRDGTPVWWLNAPFKAGMATLTIVFLAAILWVEGVIA